MTALMYNTGVKHGTISSYTNHKCRCDDCRNAWNEYYRSHNSKTGNRARYAREKYKSRRAFSLDYLGGKCRKCGSVERLEFDHIDPATKEYNVTNIFTGPIEKLISELEKCQLLCRGCHLDKTLSELMPETHGTTVQYSRGCRCQLCKTAMAQRSKRVYWERKAGLR